MDRREKERFCGIYGILLGIRQSLFGIPKSISYCFMTPKPKLDKDLLCKSKIIVLFVTIHFSLTFKLELLIFTFYVRVPRNFDFVIFIVCIRVFVISVVYSVFISSSYIQGVTEKTLRIFRRDSIIFSKTVYEFYDQLYIYPGHFKKDFSILTLSHKAKKLQVRQFLPNCFSEKAPGSEFFFLNFFF